MTLICLSLNYVTHHIPLSPWRLSPNYRANHNSSNRTKWFDLLKNWISMWGIFKIASWPTTCLVKFIWSQKELSKYYQLSMPKNQNFTDLATNGFLHKEGKFQFEGWKKAFSSMDQTTNWETYTQMTNKKKRTQFLWWKWWDCDTLLCTSFSFPLQNFPWIKAMFTFVLLK